MAAALRAAFARIGFSAEAARALYDDQGINSLQAVERMNEDEVQELVKSLRNPGGQILVNGAMVNNPGVLVAQMAIHNMKLLIYWTKHQTRISRPKIPANVQIEALDALADLRKQDKTFTKPSEMPKIDQNNWFKTRRHLRVLLFVGWLYGDPSCVCLTR